MMVTDILLRLVSSKWFGNRKLKEAMREIPLSS